MMAMVLISALLLSLTSPGPAHAQEGPQVAASPFSVKFPDSVSFTVAARASSPITRLELRYQVVGSMTCGPATSTAVPEFTPAPEVKATWTWDMRRTGGLPPGALIQFSWLVEDSQGRRLETAPALARFEDQRYPWQRLEAPGITFLWNRGDQGFARQLLQAAQASLDKLAQDTGVRPTRAVTLYIYGDSEELRSALVFPQEWTGGVAYTGHGIVAIGISPELLEWGKRALAHELTHVVVGELTFNCFGDIPVWLSEGLAVYGEGEITPGYRGLFQEAVAQDRLASVRSISSAFPASSEEATLAYAESVHLVEFLIRHGGQAQLLALLQAFKAGVDYDTALTRVYGWDTTGLDNAWRVGLGLPPRPTPTPPARIQPVPTLVPFGATPPGPTATPPSASSPTPAAPATPSPTPTGAGGGCRPSGRTASAWSLAWLALVLPPGAELFVQRRRTRRVGARSPRPRWR